MGVKVVLLKPGFVVHHVSATAQLLDEYRVTQRLRRSQIRRSRGKSDGVVGTLISHLSVFCRPCNTGADSLDIVRFATLVNDAGTR